MGKLTMAEQSNAVNEVRMLASIEHPNVISYKESFFDDQSLVIIMELCDGGDLMQKVEQYKKTHDRMKES